MKQNKGITLIALIITIIVMIILTGVSINLIFGDKGTITRFESTKMENLRVQILEKIQNETKTAVNEFGDYDQQEAINNIIKNNDGAKIKELIVETNGRLGISFEEQGHIFKYFVSNKGEVISVSEYIYEKENTSYLIKSRIGNEEKSAYDLLAPVPLGFVASKAGKNLTPATDTINEDGIVDVTVLDKDSNNCSDKYYYGEDKIEYGLVIYEGDKKVDESNLDEAKKNRNQFVWIPVKEEDLNSILDVDENGNLYYYKKIEYSEFPTKEYTILEPYFTLGDYNHENDNIININDSEITDIEFNAILRNRFNKAVENVRKVGGFYISRYDISNKNTDNNVINKSNISFMEENEPYIGENWYTYWNSQDKYNNEHISSNLIFGFQYELLNNFLNGKTIKNNDSSYLYFYKDWTTTLESYYRIISQRKDYLTGSNQYNKVNNIYDLVGYVRMLTQSAVVNSSEFEIKIDDFTKMSGKGEIKNAVVNENFTGYTTNEFEIIQGGIIKYYEPISSCLSDNIDEYYYCIYDGKVIDYNINEITKEISGNIEIDIYKKNINGAEREKFKTVNDSFFGKIDENGNIIGKTNGIYLGVAEFGGNYNDGVKGGNYFIPKTAIQTGTISSSRITLCLE